MYWLILILIACASPPLALGLFALDVILGGFRD
jgi:hypothetical protein